MIHFSQDIKTIEEGKAQGRNKRKRDSRSPSPDQKASPRRKTRSQGRRESESQLTKPIQIPDSEDDDIYQPGT